jgi:hypothetical protein
MRFLKIITFLIGLFCFCVISYFIFMIFTDKRGSNAPLMAYVYIGLAYASSILNLIYHGKSFRFYRKKENINLTKKLHKIFWAATISFNSLLLFLFGLSAYDIFRFLRYGFNQSGEQIMVMLVLLIFSVIGFLEVSLLKKRIKRLRTERTTKDEISSIGNLTP